MTITDAIIIAEGLRESRLKKSTLPMAHSRYRLEAEALAMLVTAAKERDELRREIAGHNGEVAALNKQIAEMREALATPLAMLVAAAKERDVTPLFSYEGRLYIRPCERGWVLEEKDGKPHLEEVLPDGYYHGRISVTAGKEQP